MKLKQKVKADDFVEYEGAEKPETFTHFQELQKRVEVLQENMDEIVAILRSNNLSMKKEIEAPYFKEDDVFAKLSEEE